MRIKTRKTKKTRKSRNTCKRTSKKQLNVKKGGVREQITKQPVYKANKPIKYVNKSKKIPIDKFIPKLVIPSGDDDIHIYLNLLIDLMGSYLYDAFLNKINEIYNLNIILIKCSMNVKECARNHVIDNISPAIFYGSGTDSTHFICTYNKAFDMCKNKINPLATIQSTRRIRNPCDNFKNCLWDPYENGGENCTIYAGIQKSQAHSFCQTFTLSCMLNQYLPDIDLIREFSYMKSVNGITDKESKNEILSMNAFYAKNIACKIVKYAFLNNLSINKNGDDLEFWDILFDIITQIEDETGKYKYNTSYELDSDNYKGFINYFLSFCENITYEQFKNSTFIDNVIYPIS